MPTQRITEDMGALVASADRLRDEFGCHVMLVHHFGKDAARGARGHSLLMAAVDTEIEVTRDGDAKVSTAHIVKQRDGEVGEKIHFGLRVVKIGENKETGEEVTSCVVEPADEAKVAQLAAFRPKRSKAEQIALSALESVVETDGTAPPASAGCPADRWVRQESWRQRCYQGGISHGGPRARQIAFQKTANKLELDERIGMRGEFVWLVPS